MPTVKISPSPCKPCPGAFLPVNFDHDLLKPVQMFFIDTEKMWYNCL